LQQSTLSRASPKSSTLNTTADSRPIARAAPTPASTAAVNRLHDLGSRVIVVHATPGRGGEGIARDVLQALGKRFRDRTARDPRRLQALVAIWLRAELARELVIAAADRRPLADWRVLPELCSDSRTRLTLVVEQWPSPDHVAAVGDETCQLTPSELVDELPTAMPPDTWGIFDESASPDHLLGYPPVPDVDFAFFPSACIDLLSEHDAGRVIRAFQRARGATMLWLDSRRGIEAGHGPSPRHAHAFLDTLVAPCVTVDGAITVLRGAQAAFLLDGTLLEIDPDACSADHEAHAGAPATDATATILRSYPDPHFAAAGALASGTRANAEQIAGLTLRSVARVDASFTSGHRIAPPFRSLLAAQTLARRVVGADDADPLFLAPDDARPATRRHVHNWLERIGSETGLRFEVTSGWNRYRTPSWATFYQLAAAPLIAR
jgi:hypothetical protein